MAKIITLYVAGNPLIPIDKGAFSLKNHLKHVKIIPIDNMQTMMNLPNNSLILDVAENISHVRLLHDVDQFLQEKKVSAHDMDLSYFIKLRKELGQISSLWFICVPVKSNANIINEVQHCIDQVRKIR